MNLTPVAFDPFATPVLLKSTASSESQRELWTACLLGTDASAAFNEAISVRLVGTLDRAALELAFQRLIASHEALHTSFSRDGASLLVENPSFQLAVERLSALSAEERDARVAEALRAQVTQPFDLAQAPLCRALLLELGTQEHLLLITAHHIVCDGWSMAVLLSDLATLYSNAVSGGSALPLERPLFSDYADSERSARNGEDYRRAERYWLKQLEGELPILDLPVDRPRPPFKTYSSDRVDYVLDEELVTRLKELGARKGASFFVTLLTAFNTWLHRVANTEDVIVGVPAAGQSFSGQSALVGHCVNMLPLRTSISSERSFYDVLSAVRRNLLDAYENQQLTFGTLLQKLAIPRDPSRLPLINVTFNLDQALTGDKLPFQGLTPEVATTPRAFETFDLFVNAAEKYGKLTLETQYNTDLFDRSTVLRWLASFEALLRSICSAPDRRIAEFSILTPEEQAKIGGWNAAADRSYDAPWVLSRFLGESLARYAEKIALEAKDGSFSFADLDRRSRILAAHLQQLGIGRGALVGVSLERSSRLLVAVLAVLRAGAAYVPLDPSFPKDRLTFMAEDAGLALLISERALEAELPAATIARWFFEDEPTLPDAAEPFVEGESSDPAYVIYTSGSTGKPKGVIVPNGAVVNFLRSMAERPGLAATDRLLAVTTLSFDISVLELLLPLHVGASIVLATSIQATDGSALKELIRKHAVSVLQATPATWRLLLAAGERFGSQFKALCGGEALSRSLADELLATNLELWNMYGPTETTVWSTCHRILPSERIRVGQPIANTQIYIVDQRSQIVPIGVAGELCIAGAGVTLGYLKRPELSNERFVPNPFGPGKLYRTGDLARLLADGTVECLGRADGQVKLRGYRIELGEIETVLATHQDVRQAVVVVREDRVGDQRLTAYAVPKAGTLAVEELRAHLRVQLPEYMVPQHFVEMTAFPLTPNGKVDRKKLPAPVVTASQAEGYAAPETDTERLVQKVWQKVLGLERISRSDDFFLLGGHSLLAAQVMSKLAEETKLELSMRRLFEAPTLERLAKAIDAASGTLTTSEAITRRAPDAAAPLSPMQQRLWFMEEMNPGTSVYNLPSCFRLQGKLDANALARALNTIAARHSTLRTTLDWHNGELSQVVAAQLSFDLSPVDLTALDRPEREARVRELLEQEAARPFSLTQGPLVRARVYLLSEQESVLFFMPHHAIWDGWSFDVFLDELDHLYAAYSRGETPKVPTLSVSYGDYAAWHKNWLTGAELERQTQFWLEQLGGELPILDLPTDAPRPVSMSFAGATEAFNLSADLVAKLSELGKRSGATLYMVLLAAFDVLLFRLTGQGDLIVGTPIRGRSRPELEPLIGYFVNALALRMKVEAGHTFAQLLSNVRETCVRAFGHQDMPFEILVQKLKIERDTSRTPLYSAFFTFQDVRNRKSSIGDLSYSQIHVHPPVSPTDLSLWVKQLDSGVVGGLDYATDLFRQETAVRWLAEYQELLKSIVENSDVSVAKLRLLPLEEQRALARLSDTERPYPSSQWVHQLVEAQVDRTPEAVALVFEGTRLTFNQLDQRANRLAQWLRSAGVGAGQRVGICLERSAELLIAALGVHKAGAAYVPLDPAFPEDRLRHMVEDSGLVAIIVHRQTRDEAPITQATRVFDLDQDADSLAAQPASRVTAPAGDSANAPAYVIYTSGSTGKPKGVIVPHRAAVNFLTSMAREPGIRAGDCLLAVTTLSFDISVLELFGPLCVGARVVIASRETGSSGDLLDEAIEEHDVTLMQATPSTWRLLLAAGFKKKANFKVLCGGEALPRDLAEQLLDVADQVWNMYGPTETTVWSTCSRLQKPLNDILIGRPIANTTVHVVDPHGGLTPWGCLGELWIGGDGVALGYHARPELTAERFLSNPFAPGQVYRTGDIVRLRLNGELEYVRRNDNQVKLRGYRIELGEIESSLTRVAGVEQAVVVVSEVRPNDRRLVAYLVWASGSDTSDARLRKELRVTLPEYMVPQHFVAMERLPLTPNGKVDRKALPNPIGAGSDVVDASYVAPNTDREKLLAELWQELLGVPRVSAHDNFFDIGGHSLLCLQMTARLEQVTGTRLNPRIILRNNLSQVAALLPDAPAKPQPAEAPPPPAPARSSLTKRLLGRLIGR